MRGLPALLLLGCGGAPSTPAHLELVGAIPTTTTDTPAAFDANDTLVLMDGGSGLRRLVGTHLDVVPGGGLFTFGRFGVDLDGALLLGSFSTLQIARLEANDQIGFISPSPPSQFNRLAGFPSGTYHISVTGMINTLKLTPGAVSWVDSMKGLERTLRGPDGSTFVILDGDIARLGPDDSPQLIASCSEFAGGTCPDLELAGVDGDGAIHMAKPGSPTIHILDPGSGTFREVTMPGKLVIQSMATGSRVGLVIATDPDRNNERSAWLLEQGATEVLRFATFTGLDSFVGMFPLVDHAGNAYVAGEEKLQAVVLDHD